MPAATPLLRATFLKLNHLSATALLIINSMPANKRQTLVVDKM